MSRFLAGWVVASTVVLGATAVQAQTWAYPDDAVIVRRGPYGALPPGPVRGGYIDDEPYDDAVPAREVVKMVRSLGFKPLGPAVRRQGVYTVSAVNRQGEQGRVVVDALSGRMMRFVSATAGNTEPGGASAAASTQPPREAPKADAAAPRPPSAPRVASRTPPNQSPTSPPAPVQPSEAPAATAATTPEAPRNAAATGAASSAQPKTAEVKAVEAKPSDTRSVQAKPSVQLLPTQEMPPVQGLD